MAYKDKAVDVRQVGRDLNVRYVLEGSIQRQEDRLRVTAQLIEFDIGRARLVGTLGPAARRSLRRSIRDSPSTSRIGSADMPGTVIAADREAAKRKRPSDLTAYDLYLLGLEAQRRGTKEGIEEAVGLFKRSLEIDPGLARAWTSLSFCYASVDELGGRWIGVAAASARRGAPRRRA